MMSRNLKLNRCLPLLAALLLVGLGSPAAVDADGIAYTAQGGTIQRTSLATGNTTTVGPASAEVAALAFAPDGELWGLSTGGVLLRNLSSGLGTQVANPFGSNVPDISDMTFDPAGNLWVVGEDGGQSMLYEVDVVLVDATAVGPLSVPVTGVSYFDGALYGLADFQLYTIDPASAATTLASDAFFADALAIDFTINGHLWLLSTIPGVDPEEDFLVGYETEFGEEVGPSWVVPSPAHGLAIERQGGCSPTGTEMCLLDDRFRVEVVWGNFQGGSGNGGVVPETSDRSGLFYFFNPDNWEMLVKMLDGCTVNDHFWLFAAQATNVEYTLVVTDTETGQVNTYLNPLGETPQPITDTAAFATCP